MLSAFENGNIRVLIKYHEVPVYKNSHELETLPGNPALVKQKNHISGIELINVHTKEIINISPEIALAIAENVKEIFAEMPPPVTVNEAELSW